jgi:S1-C subfamily serine protease
VDPGLVDINTTLNYQGEEAAGTGMVLTSTGEILTNNHVIDGATSISVTDIGNGKTYTATVVGYDRTDDVAVLQLAHASGLKTVDLGDSSAAKIGESVVAIGNAGGSVTALNESITASDDGGGNAEQLSGLLETNAGIEPGDSGGPLVNTSGQVLGMDTAASTDGTSSQSSAQSTSGTVSSGTQAYAIPIDKALSLAKQIEAGTASTTVHIGATAFLGVEVESTDAGSSGTGSFGGFGGFGDSGQGTTGGTTSGALVAGIASGTPASVAGLSAGDTITSVGDHTVSSPTALSQVMLTLKAGQSTTITYVNLSGQSETTTVTLTAGPPQ